MTTWRTRGQFERPDSDGEVASSAGVSGLNFRHHGLTADLDCFEKRRRSWDQFLESFRDYVESGQGSRNSCAEDEVRGTQETGSPLD
jgi:hypothetical protein